MEEIFCLSLLFNLVYKNFTTISVHTVPHIGIIGPVTNIRSIIYNCTNINIYWDSPTLDDDRVSILYYNLSIYDDINSQKIKSVSVYDTSYQFEDQDLFIHRYTYVITAVNELGKGISNNKTFSYQRSIIIYVYYNHM